MKWFGGRNVSLIECLTNHSYGKADGIVLEAVGVTSGSFPRHISVMLGGDCDLKCVCCYAELGLISTWIGKQKD
jgi:hypothetical protein